jgi:DNA modification methylase
MAELVWEGKYDKDGRRAAPLRVALPFQTVETVNESAQDRQRSLDLFATGRDPAWRNRLIWGDKKYVLPALLDEFAGKVDLIYVDPPFATGQDFSLPVQVANGDAQFVKEPSVIEVKAYRDTWGGGLDGYLEWFYGMASHLRELLAESGSIYVHLDPGVSHFVKAVLDELFGIENFRNEIIWKRTTAHSSAQKYAPVHDSILYYSKSASPTWNAPRAEYTDEYLAKYYKFDDGDGRLYWRADLTAAGVRKGETGKTWRGLDPNTKGRHWMLPPAQLDRLDEDGQIYWPPGGSGWPQHKRYREDLKGRAVSDIWDDVDRINPVGGERVGYPTQKPEALLERIIDTSSTEDDLVLDCVCGSGTTAVAAEKLRRRWIVADLGRFAVHTTRKRLLSVADVKPFVVQNLGKYERQLWQEAEFGASATARTTAYRSFILDLYHAKPIEGYAWLHGVKNGRMVHVSTVDAPVTVGDVRQIATEFRKVIGTGKDAPTAKSVDVLGWDFAFELNEVARQEAAKAGIEMRFVRIPREVLEKRAVEQGDITFFELAALAVDVERKSKKVSVSLTDFVIPLDEVPAEVQSAITSWTQWIDYWAIDWDNKDDTFHNQWQSYRTRKNNNIDMTASHEYNEPGTYTVVVKVIDILGNDTTKTVSVTIPGRAA